MQKAKPKPKTQEKKHQTLDQPHSPMGRQIYRTKTQLLMPGKDLSSLSSGGRTGYTKSWCLAGSLGEKPSLRTGLFSVYMENLLLFKALCTPEPQKYPAQWCFYHHLSVEEIKQ